MKAIGFTQAGPFDRPGALVEHDLPVPLPGGRDLLVAIRAVSVNPVDTKVRSGPHSAGTFRVLGYDAVGVVEAVGPEVTLFRPGDRVFYAGSIQRQGSNAELQLVDERIVGPAPSSLSDPEAAALPLTAITAWEMLFDRLDVNRPVPVNNRTLLLLGGAGGVGSIAIQIAKAVAGMTVIATASRPETAAWAEKMGADHVVDHGSELIADVAALHLGHPGFVFSTTQTASHFAQILELIAPQGRLGVISGIGPETHPDPLSSKSITLCYELMFTRWNFHTPDLSAQHELLANVSKLVDAGTLKTTLGEHFGRISAANLIRAHAFVESGKAIGKVVLEGF